MDDAQMAALFEKHLAATDNWLQAQDNFQVLYVHYSDILADPMTEVQKINAFLGGKMNIMAMAGQVDPELYWNRQD
jgi:hypothetical protein